VLDLKWKKRNELEVEDDMRLKIFFIEPNITPQLVALQNTTFLSLND
jgi:hypothetical protein